VVERVENHPHAFGPVLDVYRGIPYSDPAGLSGLEVVVSTVL
jgi:hypothetical protein